MTEPDALKSLPLLVAAFEDLGIAYCLGGSVASSAYGVPRATMDVDIVAPIAPSHVEELVQRLSADYYVDDEMIREAIRHRTSFNVIHLATMAKVDVFIPKGRAFDEEVLRRRRLEDFADTGEEISRFYVASAEDVVLAKLEWYRKGKETSQQQWKDVIGVLKVQSGSLDRAYLLHWAPLLGIDDLLAKALAESGD